MRLLADNLGQHLCHQDQQVSRTPVEGEQVLTRSVLMARCMQQTAEVPSLLRPRAVAMLQLPHTMSHANQCWGRLARQT